MYSQQFLKIKIAAANEFIQENNLKEFSWDGTYNLCYDSSGRMEVDPIEYWGEECCKLWLEAFECMLSRQTPLT